MPADLYQVWFKQIWSDITGAATAKHPAPFPEPLAERLICMFSFVGDTVLDPFMGSATTNYVAGGWGRNSVGIEVDPDYFAAARKRMAAFSTGLFKNSASKTTSRENGRE